MLMMKRRSGLSSAAGRKRRAIALPEMIAPLAPLLVSTWTWSAGVLVVKAGTVMPPAAMMA